MRPRDYLVDRLPLLLAFAVAVALLLLVVHLGHAPLAAADAGYIALLAVVMTTLILSVDYLRHRDFRRNVARRVDAGHNSLAPLPRGATREQRALAELLVGAQRESQAELQQRRVAAEEHRAFIELWVHQMKTPLTVLELTAQQELADEEPGGPWHSAVEELDQLSNGLELMLTNARLERFDLDLTPASVDLAEAVRTAVNQLKRSWLRTGVFPKVHAPVAGVRVETDAKWLQVVLRQLLTNAIKYSSSGQTVTISVAAREGGATIAVADAGIGIPQEDLPRVFERFYTGANGRRGQAATGMGLYLAAEICRRLGHLLELESQPGEGTTASITIRPQGLHREVTRL